MLARLDALRDELGAPVSITSGYRCAAYQAELKARGYETAGGISQHELGNAADLIAKDLDKLKEVARKHFLATGEGKTFVHCDTRADKERRWFYYKR